jgi:hypothetical protein
MTTVALRAIGAGVLDRDNPTTVTESLVGFVPTGEFAAGQCNRPWLMFDIYHIPPDAVVSSAVLTLTVDSNFLGASHTLAVYRSKRRQWAGTADTSGATAGHPQSRASWNNYNQGGGLAWQTAGGSGANDRDASAIGTSATLTSATSGLVSITLDAASIEAALQGSFVWNGLLLQASVETDNSNTLTITYTSALESAAITDNLVASYKLSDTADASGNGHTLTNVNSTTFVSGKIGNAAHFVSASNQRLTNNDAALKPGSGNWTCVFWAKLTDLASLYTAVSQWNAGPGAVGGGGWRVFYHQQSILDYYVLQLNDAAGSAEVSDVVGYSSGAIGSAGTYIMVAVRHDAARKNLHLGFGSTMSKANSSTAHASSEG